MERIKVYSKEKCMPCKATVMHLGRLAIEHEVIMLEDHPEIREELIAEGYLQSPVVDTGEEKWSGYRPDKLNELKEKHPNELDS